MARRSPALGLIEPDSAVGGGPESPFCPACVWWLRTLDLAEGFYRPARGGEFARITGGRGGRCRFSCRRSCEVGAGGCSGMSGRPLLSSLPRARVRSRWCCQRAEAVCSCAAPVGRRSLGWMPLAARHTATSPMMAAFGRLPGGAHTGWVSSWPAWPRIRLALSVTSVLRQKLAR